MAAAARQQALPAAGPVAAAPVVEDRAAEAGDPLPGLRFDHDRAVSIGRREPAHVVQQHRAAMVAAPPFKGMQNIQPGVGDGLVALGGGPAGGRIRVLRRGLRSSFTDWPGVLLHGLQRRPGLGRER